MSLVHYVFSEKCVKCQGYISVMSVATYLLCRWLHICYVGGHTNRNNLLRFSVVVDVISYGEKFQSNLDISR